MAHIRLGQSIRNAVVEASPRSLTAEVYPPISPARSAPAPPPPDRRRGPAKAQAEIGRQFEISLGEVTRASESMREEMRVLGEAVDLVRRDLEALARDLGGMRQSFWERFDELEIKVRPLIQFDADSWAVRLMDGYAMIPRTEAEFTVMVANAGSGGLEPGTRRVLQALIRPGMTVADVGANVGLLTLACARACGPSGRVHAFEPEAGPRGQLAKTVRLNGLHWVQIHDCAVGAASGEADLHVSPVIGHSSLYPLPAGEAAQGHDAKVAVTTLDDLLAGEPLDVVKIDVEGAELDVLAGMDRLLRQNPDIALVVEFGLAHLARVGNDPEAWLAPFQAKGFSPFAIEEPWGACAPFRLADMADLEWVNLAFVRPGGAAALRLPTERP